MATTHDQPRPGPQDPVVATRPRPPSSARRTTSIDVTRPDGLAGRVVALVTGQDLVTDADGRSAVVRRVELAVTAEPVGGAVLAVEPGATAGTARVDAGDGGATADSDSVGLDGLVGAGLRSGFGRRVAALLPEEAVSRSLRWSLLEDLAGAFLVAGYAPLRAGLYAGDVEATKARAPLQADICVGWATGGPIHRALAERGHTAVPVGPPAPAIERGDPAGWHALAPLDHGTVRRRRQLDVTRAADGRGLRVHAHFRDSYAGDEAEMVMHEYAVEAAVADDRIATIDVEPRVLPWRACPGAVASAQRVVGVPVDELARAARTELVGATTCTHLTSTLRSLADVRALARAVRSW